MMPDSRRREEGRSVKSRAAEPVVEETPNPGDREWQQGANRSPDDFEGEPAQKRNEKSHPA